MKKEVISKAVTIEGAVDKAVSELGVDRDDCQIEVMETPKKSFFGKIKEAVVKVTVEIEEQQETEVKVNVSEKPSDELEVSALSHEKLTAAKGYLNDIFHAMGFSSLKLEIQEKEDGAVMTCNGDGIAVLIGHHGETLDALQYLVALTCNRLGGDYYRITLDCGNYRKKRQKTLEDLAARIAKKVKRTGRSQLLEPMNPYERRIIHSVVTEIDGVTSKSRGEEPNRRVVILSEHPVKSYHKNEGKEDFRSKNDAPYQRERTMEEILKNDFKEREEKADLYSKIKF